MRAIWTGTLLVGQVSIPVGLGIAASREGSGFRLLHRACGTPISQRRRCETCGLELRSNDEIVSGYEFATGQFAIFEAGELEAALKGKTIALDRFVPPSEIPPELVDRVHWLTPAKDMYAETAYAVLRAALERTGLAGLGQVVLQTKELPCVVSSHPDEQVLMLRTLFMPAHVRRPIETWRRIATVTVTEELLALAVEAIEARTATTFRPTRLETWFRPRLPEIVRRKAAGGKVAVPEPTMAAPRDLEAALRKSIKRTKQRQSNRGGTRT
jgi:DNA end-binding protein Ku